MKVSNTQRSLLKKLPGVDKILEFVKDDIFYDEVPQKLLVSSIRETIENLREAILHKEGGIDEHALEKEAVGRTIRKRVESRMQSNLRRTVNATGVVMHTNLGRSLLPHGAVDHILQIAGRYSNLEMDLATGKRGLRYSAVEDLICEISGAESTLVVNNNAAAVLLCLETMTKDREVVVSRGELVEIGGSFRIPDVMAKSGGILKEVGTTNRTHLRDYESAINENTALLLKVHTSNYSVVGFTAAVSLKEMVSLGHGKGIPVMEDLGSGTFVDFSQYGLAAEPTVQASVAAGTDIVTFSGDKLLGGPQAGIIVGKREYIDDIKKNPLTRALRIDKLTLAALEGTLRLYRDEKKAVEKIPTLRMLTLPKERIDETAEKMADLLNQIGCDKLEVTLMEMSSRAGGGSLPLLELPSRCVCTRVKGLSANSIEKIMRGNTPPVIGRIEDGFFIMDPRTLQDEEPEIIRDAFKTLIGESRQNENTIKS